MKGSTRIAVFLGMVAGAGLCPMCLVGATVLLGPGLTIDFTRRDRVLLRLPGRHQSSDLVLLRLGQPLDQARSLVEDANLGSALLFLEQDGDLRPLGDAQFGGFLPGAPYLLIQYLEDSETHVERVPLRAGRASPILESSAALNTILLGNRSIFLHEASASRQRCYLSRSGEQARRVGRGAQCLASRDGSIPLAASAPAPARDRPPPRSMAHIPSNCSRRQRASSLFSFPPTARAWPMCRQSGAACSTLCS